MRPWPLVNRAIDLVGPLPLLLDSRATVHLARHEAAEALQDLASIQADKVDPVWLFHKARALLLAGRIDEAAAAMAEARNKGLVRALVDPPERPLFDQLQQQLAKPRGTELSGSFLIGEELAMRWVGVVAAVVLMAIVLIDAFEVVLLPRRVRHGFRLARLFYRTSWMVGRTAARLLPPGRWRTGFLSAFGPLSLFVLVVLWAVGLIAGFALLHWSLGTALSVAHAGFGTYLYFSGTTFFTLGYGDMVPIGAAGRALSVAESGIGFVFLAVIVSYLPVLYQAFSRLEITHRAARCPGRFPAQRRRTAAAPGRRPQPVRRRPFPGRVGALGGGSAGEPHLVSGAELLPLAARKPVVGRLADGHPRHLRAAAWQAWTEPDGYQARLTFAMARHAAVDLALVFQTPPLPPQPDRSA